MEARERAAEIVHGFYKQIPAQTVEDWATEEVTELVIVAQREAIADYQVVIREYGRRNGYAQKACDRLIQLGDALLDQYE